MADSPPVLRNQSGQWLVSKDESDALDEFFAKMGVGWIARKIVSNVNVQYEIRQTPTVLRQTDITSMGRHHVDYVVDGLWHDVKQVGNKLRPTKVSQDDITGALSIEVQLGQEGGTTVDTRRLLTRTRLEQRLSLYRDGVCASRVRRVWTKVETPEQARAGVEAEARARQMLALDAVAAAGVGAFGGGSTTAGKGGLPGGGVSRWSAAYDIPVDHFVLTGGGGAAAPPPSSPQAAKAKRGAAGATQRSSGDARRSAFGVNLSGRWEIDSGRSDSMGPLLKALGVPWLARSMAESLRISTTMRHAALPPSDPAQHTDPAEGHGEEERKPSSGVSDTPLDPFCGSLTLKDVSSLGTNVSHLVLDGVPRRRTGDDGKSILICAVPLTPAEVYLEPPFTPLGHLPEDGDIPQAAAAPFPDLALGDLPPVCKAGTAAAATCLAALGKEEGLVGGAIEWPAPQGDPRHILRGTALRWADDAAAAAAGSPSVPAPVEGGVTSAAGGTAEAAAAMPPAASGAGGVSDATAAADSGSALPAPPIAIRIITVLTDNQGVTVDTRQLLDGGRALRSTTDLYTPGCQLACRMVRVSTNEDFAGAWLQVPASGAEEAPIGVEEGLDGDDGESTGAAGGDDAPLHIGGGSQSGGVSSPLVRSGSFRSGISGGGSLSDGSASDGDSDGPMEDEMSAAVNFSGKWRIDWGRSQRLDAFLSSVGVSWLARKVVSGLDVSYEIDHTPVEWCIKEASSLGTFTHKLLADGRFHMVPQQNDGRAPMRCMQDRSSGDLIVETLLLGDPSNDPAVKKMLPVALQLSAQEARLGVAGGADDDARSAGSALSLGAHSAGAGDTSASLPGPRKRRASDFNRRYGGAGGRGRAGSGDSAASGNAAGGAAGLTHSSPGSVGSSHASVGLPPPPPVREQPVAQPLAPGDAISGLAPEVSTAAAAHNSESGALWERISKLTARILDIRHADGRVVQRQVLMYITADGVAKNAVTRYYNKVETSDERLAAEAAAARAGERSRQRRALRRRRQAAAREEAEDAAAAAAEGGDFVSAPPNRGSGQSEGGSSSATALASSSSQLSQLHRSAASLLGPAMVSSGPLAKVLPAWDRVCVAADTALRRHLGPEGALLMGDWGQEHGFLFAGVVAVFSVLCSTLSGSTSTSAVWGGLLLLTAALLGAVVGGAVVWMAMVGPLRSASIEAERLRERARRSRARRGGPTSVRLTSFADQNRLGLSVGDTAASHADTPRAPAPLLRPSGRGAEGGRPRSSSGDGGEGTRQRRLSGSSAMAASSIL